MSQEIIAFKLINGMEIIGRKVEETESLVVLEKARVVQMVQTGERQVQMVLQPFMISDIDGEISFRKDGLVTNPITPSEEVEKPYMKETTTIALV